MRGFQIWSKKSNRIISDHILAKGRSKIGKIGYFASFRRFFSQKEGQMSSDLNFETSLLGHCNIGTLEHWKHWTALIKVHFLEHKMKGIENFIFGHY